MNIENSPLPLQGRGEFKNKVSLIGYMEGNFEVFVNYLLEK
jgi:hypothetical protein